jgi:hypothetical protein
MKDLLILILFIPIFSFSQSTGKIVRNQSLKLEATNVDDTLWLVRATNMNTCPSTIDVSVEGLIIKDSTELKQFETLAIALLAPFSIKVRNAVPCANGTMGWLELTTNMDVLKIDHTFAVQKSYPINCEKNPFHLPRLIVRDTTIATKPMLKR